ncbi:MAG: hypothetical protein MI923_05380 [Phycisphaerales bacterium]|nr:hypothetical protein [Phycisphaerales bacterium]
MTLRILFLLTVLILLLASPAGAQINLDENIRMDNVEALPFERPILEYVCAVGFLLAALAIGFKPSRRTND